MKAERDAFYAQDPFEFERSYSSAEEDAEIVLPITTAGFELLLAAVCCVVVIVGYCTVAGTAPEPVNVKAIRSPAVSACDGL